MDPEISAMSKIAEALQNLEESARVRVLAWAVQKFEPATASGGGGSASPDITDGSSPLDRFNEFHELVDAADPQIGLERILVAGYWFQEVQKHDSLEAFELNRALKDLGHPAGNITRDLSRLMARSPKLVIQVRKEGTTKQARKKYRLTRAGVQQVENMIGERGL